VSESVVDVVLGFVLVCVAVGDVVVVVVDDGVDDAGGLVVVDGELVFDVAEFVDSGDDVVVLGFVVVCVVVGEAVVVVFVVDGGDIVDVVLGGAFVVDDGVDLFAVVGELVFDVVESGDDVVVTFGEMVETRVVGVVEISSQPH